MPIGAVGYVVGVITAVVRVKTIAGLVHPFFDKVTIQVGIGEAVAVDVRTVEPESHVRNGNIADLHSFGG